MMKKNKGITYKNRNKKVHGLFSVKLLYFRLGG
jgi:hypothetical protein